MKLLKGGIIFLQPLEFNENLQPICLPKKEEASAESKINFGVTVQGWNPTAADDDDLNDYSLTEIIVNIR